MSSFLNNNNNNNNNNNDNDVYGKRVESAIGLISAAVDQCTSSIQLDTSPNHNKKVELDVPLPFIDSSTNSNNTCKCKPWDYSLFISRASTFKISNWFAKPREVGPLQCARHGWINSGPNQLECTICGAQIWDEVSKTLNYEGERNASLSLKERLNETHKDQCPWKNNPSPKTFLKFQIKSDQTMFTNVILRKQSIRKAINNDNDDINNTTTSQTKKRKRTIQNNFNLNITNMSTFQENKFVSTCKDSLLLLSLFGWSSGSGSKDNNENKTLKCALCNRQVGLWNEMDPLNSHRYFCPLRTVNQMPDGTTRKKGFEIVVEAYLRYKEKHSRKNNIITDDGAIIDDNNDINNSKVVKNDDVSMLKPEDALRLVKNAFISTKRSVKYFT